ncbi:MAG TPA: hypothetical protein PKY30_01985 [Myxococcota bacterium]|nr:hypothetical protein [Myxococcota bacterium]HNH45773.1 hypothetical protein [Myxococcota bacterium]
MRMILAALLLGGCGSSIKGDVDGDKVKPLSSGFWFAVGSGNNEGIYAVATSVPSACKVFTEVYDAQADAYRDFAKDFDVDTLVDDMEAAEQDNLPEEYWATSVALDADPDDDEDVEGEYDVEDDEVFINVIHQRGYTDYEKVYVDQDSDGYQTDSFYADEGVLDVKSFKDEGSLSGSSELALRDTDDKNAGDVTLNLSVSYCEDAEDAYAGYLEVLAGF